MLSCARSSLFLETPFHSLQPSMLRGKKRGFATWLEKHFFQVNSACFDKRQCLGTFFAVSCTVHVNLKSNNPAPAHKQKTHIGLHKFIHTHMHTLKKPDICTLTHKHYPNSPIVINHQFSWGLHGWRFRHSTQHSTSWYSWREKRKMRIKKILYLMEID